MEQYPDREPTEEERLRDLPQWMRPKWVRVCMVPVAYLAILALLILQYSPLIALLYGVSLAVAGAMALTVGSPACTAYLAAAVTPYIVLTVFTYCIILTFNHQHCGKMLTGFWRHTFTHRPSQIAVAAIEAAFWPLTWGVYDRSLTGWGLSWSMMVLQAVDIWLYMLFTFGRPRGIMVTEYRIEPDPPKE